jgi:hypothetical protein
MTKLLKEAIAQLKTRPISEQDSLVENLPSAIAALILEELYDNDDLGFSVVGVPRLHSAQVASPVENRFQKSWKQAVEGNTLPLSQLWEDSEVD